MNGHDGIHYIVYMIVSTVSRKWNLNWKCIMNWTLDATLGVIYTRICRLPKRVLWLSAALYVSAVYVIREIRRIYFNTRMTSTQQTWSHTWLNCKNSVRILPKKEKNYTIILLLYAITRTRVTRLDAVQKLTL